MASEIFIPSIYGTENRRRFL